MISILIVTDSERVRVFRLGRYKNGMYQLDRLDSFLSHIKVWWTRIYVQLLMNMFQFGRLCDDWRTILKKFNKVFLSSENEKKNEGDITSAVEMSTYLKTAKITFKQEVICKIFLFFKSQNFFSTIRRVKLNFFSHQIKIDYQSFIWKIWVVCSISVSFFTLLHNFEMLYCFLYTMNNFIFILLNSFTSFIDYLLPRKNMSITCIWF